LSFGKRRETYLLPAAGSRLVRRIDMNWMDTGRFLIVAGTVIVVVGFIFLMADKIPLGRLPGDLRFGSEKFRIYIPIATCVLLSVVITLIMNFFSRK